MAGRNPYHYGSPAEGENFTDRERELELLRISMLNSQNLILISPRRWGKSSLLHRTLADVRRAGGATGRVSFVKCAGRRDVVETLAAGILNGPVGGARGRGTRLLEGLKRIRIAPEVQIGAGGEVSVRLLPALADEDWRGVLADVAGLLRASTPPRRPVSLVMDEFQRVHEIDPALAGVFKDLVDELAEVSLVFAGSKRHLMEAMTADTPTAALFGVGRKLYLTRIPEDRLVPFLIERAAAGGKRMGEAAAAQAYAAAHGVPNDVQLVAFWAFEGAGAEVTGADVERALADAVGDQAVEFARIFDSLAPSQRRLLRLVAAGGVRRLSTREVMTEMGVSSPNAVTKARAGLEAADLIQREADGAWSVSSGLLRRWLIRD